MRWSRNKSIQQRRQCDATLKQGWDDTTQQQHHYSQEKEVQESAWERETCHDCQLGRD